MTTPRAVARPRHLALSAVALACLLAVVGCSSGSGDSPSESAAAPTTETESSNDTGASASAPDANSSSASATLTLDDGTVYEITDVTSCDTSATDPAGFPLSNGFDLTGTTADGEFLINASRAGFDDENAVFAGALEGDFDSSGKNAMMLYSMQGDGSDLTIDGASISGTVDAKAISPTRPHGDNTSITIEATC